MKFFFQDILHTSTPNEQVEKSNGKKPKNKKSVSKQLIKDSKDESIQIISQKPKTSKKKQSKNTQDINNNEGKKIKQER